MERDFGGQLKGLVPGTRKPLYFPALPREARSLVTRADALSREGPTGEGKPRSLPLPEALAEVEQVHQLFMEATRWASGAEKAAAKDRASPRNELYGQIAAEHAAHPSWHALTGDLLPKLAKASALPPGKASTITAALATFGRRRPHPALGEAFEHLEAVRPALAHVEVVTRHLAAAVRVCRADLASPASAVAMVLDALADAAGRILINISRGAPK